MYASETWQLRFYQTPESRVPFRQWQASLTDPRVAAAVEVRLDRLRQGLFGDCKPVGEGVLEIRIDLGPGFRGYFVRSGRRVILLLCGGDKRTQSSDIEKAKKYRRDYEQRIRAAVRSS